jgi:hypothetical protein
MSLDNILNGAIGSLNFHSQPYPSYIINNHISINIDVFYIYFLFVEIPCLNRSILF